MLAITQPNKVRKLTPNLLPCSIKHNGPVNAAERYWKPQKASDGTSTAYLRGRKLRGKTLKIPEGYQGVVLEKTDKSLAQTSGHWRPPVPVGYGDEDDEDGDMEESEDSVEVKVMEQKAAFDELAVWGHEVVPEDDNLYTKGVQEWIAFATAVSTLSTQSVLCDLNSHAHR